MECGGTRPDFSKVRVLLGEPSATVGRSMWNALMQVGFRDVGVCATFADLRDRLKDGQYDLLVVNSEMDVTDSTPLIRDVRRSALHDDPFLVVLLVVARADETHIRLAINSGADDILLAPFTAEQMMQRLASVHQRRKPFIVTHDYIGPDRRQGPRPGAGTARSYVVPNPYLARSTGVEDAHYQAQVQTALASMTRARLASLVRACQWELQALRAATGGGMPADLAARLNRLDGFAEEMGARTRDRADGQRIAAFRQACRDLASGGTLARLDQMAAAMLADEAFSPFLAENDVAGLVRAAAAQAGDKAAKPPPAARPPSPVSPVASTPVASAPVVVAPAADEGDISYALPPHLAHLLRRIQWQGGELPPPAAGFADFDALCTAAILRRIDRVLVFFQRSNAEVDRQLPPPFLLSPKFAAKFHDVVRALVLPSLLDSRQVRLLAASLDPAKVNADSFWELASPVLKTSLLDMWNARWDDMRLVAVAKEDGSMVFQVKEDTKHLRAMLQPDTPQDYDLPRLHNREIEVLKTVLDPTTDWWAQLNRLWHSCRDLYEQEKDPRVFQQQAREGALRDKLLVAFDTVPDRWGDFVILACHRVFPRINSHFLARFLMNFGKTDAEREARMPYLMRYLRQVGENPAIRRSEEAVEAEWRSQEQALRQYFRDHRPLKAAQ